MFSEYALIDIDEICRKKSISVLNKLPEINGPQLVASLIKPLVNSINNKSKNLESSQAFFQDDKDVLWVMEVICYGLSLPLSDNEQYEAVRDCVNIYCEWLHALSSNLSQDKFIPNPIKQNPNLYCQKIIGHLYNTFLPRTFAANEAANDLISKQALICHRILRLLITIATEPDNVISAQTWERLLVFLLGINEKLLKSPTDVNDIGTQLADRVISSLFQGWLISCVYFFPSPSYWRTFQNVCINSRHRPALISQWNRVNICLTRRLVSILYNHELSIPIDNKFNFSQYNTIVILLNEEVLKQCWYRFLHIIGNPVDLCFPKIIYKSEASKNSHIDGTLIHILPFIFHKAIKGLSTLVDIFLAIPNINLSDVDYEFPKFPASNSDQTNSTPPEKRKSVKRENLSVLKGDKLSRNNVHQVSKNLADPYGLPNIVLPNLQGNFYQNHLKLSSVLDVFGKWFFQAAFICVPNLPNDLLEKSLTNQEASPFSVNKLDHNPINRHEAEDSCLDLYEAGQAEALGALCRIFCLKKDDEDISYILSKQNTTDSNPDYNKMRNYVTSFYLALKYNLNTINDQCKIQILSSILVNSVHFFEVDLPGSKILIPHFFRCIEYFLSRKDKSDNIAIRKACIKILISLLSYPLHYKDLSIRDNLTVVSSNSFISFYPRLILLFIHGLYNETDQTNVQMILNAFLFIMEDCVYHNDGCCSQESNSSGKKFNLVDFFNSSPMNLQYNQLQTEKLGMNLFLLISSLVSDVLCKCSSNSNYNISLTAIEILMALGRVKYQQKLLCNNKCSLCIQQICRFIENQCYKPAMYHSKDMHSTIVAAYQCLSIWINEHHHLIKDKNCISMLFELIELGISGSKSKKEEGDFKAEKIIKPASLRVREAAELLLTTMMSRMEIVSTNLLNDCIIPCDINESKITELIFNIKSTEYSFNQFRYFIVENSLLISILEKQINHGESVCIVRSAYGKYCFFLKHQSMSNRHSLNFSNDVTIYRTLNKPENPPRNMNFNYFPEHYEKICNSKYDNIISNISKYIKEQEDIKKDYDMMSHFLEKVENNLNFEKTKLTLGSTKKDINEPPPSKMFETYRLILSQFENFNFDFKNKNDKSGLIILNNSSQNFIEHLLKLDMISSKINDFIMIFYVSKNFKDENEIFRANYHQYLNNATFKYFLNSLGNPISCETRISSNIFYWNDVLNEIIFISPTKYGQSLDNLSLDTFLKENNENIRNLFMNKTHNHENERPNDKIKEFLFGNNGCDIKIFVLWLEKMEDFDRLPFKNYCVHDPENATELEKYFFIFIHPLKNGLFKVLNFCSNSKFNFPIMDRMLLSKHLLASYIRLTALNLFRRRRMNIESLQLPHVRRRVKIQEMANKFKLSSNNQKLASEIFKSKFL